MKKDNRSLPVPANENERLKALKRYGVLDTLPEEDFDAITRLASYLCDTPIALVSLIDEERQWFKSRVGLDAEETPREISFCQYAIMDEQIFEISNALDEERFVDNPLVTGSPNIRFYAGAPLVNPEGLNIGTLCVIDTVPKNLTEAQRDALQTLAREVVSHLELRQQKATLEQANQRLSQFAYVAAHDLRAPLRAVERLSTFIKADLAQGHLEDVQEQFDLLVSRVVRMDALLEGLLDYSKIGAAKAVKKSIDLGAQIKAVLEALDIPDHISITVQPHFPSLKIDGLRFQQIIQNLVTNAIKHHDKPEGHIHIGWEERNSLYHFSVADDGPGIDPAYHHKIFEVFQTLQARDEVESTGIGLSIVKRIVEEEGGELWLESEAGQGTTFFFSLHKTD